MFKYVCISLVLLTAAHHTNGWNWKCENGFCIRDKYGVNSIELCRLICGNYGAFWPIPTQMFNNTGDLNQVDPKSFQFKFKAPDSLIDLMDEVVHIFKNNLYAECKKNCNGNGILVKVHVKIESKDLKLTWQTDESYTIQSRNDEFFIEAKTFYGARHGIETLSQLVAPFPGGLTMLKTVFIQDKPFYPHRSLLLDTARNYMSVAAIKRQLDGMAASKLNYFHWHITDSQSFPYESKSLPKLSQTGAYSPKQVYTDKDIKELIHYALVRGIRIIIEIDSPAHVGFGWGWGPESGLGNLVACLNQQPWRSYCIEPPCGQFNPANENVYKMLELLYKDLVDQFPHSDMFHMGGDEIFIPCWNSTKEILDYMKSQRKGQSLDDFLDLWSEFHAKALAAYDKSVGNQNSTILLWSSDLTAPNIIQKYLDKNRYVIETWVPSTDPLPNELLSKGYRLIISTKNAWYLDHGFWGSTSYYSWHTVYSNKLINHKNVLGGEVCMWSEFVDEEALDGRVWPRAAAAAERLWSNPKKKVQESVRMFRHRERLVSRGIKAETLTPAWCYYNEGQCGYAIGS